MLPLPCRVPDKTLGGTLNYTFTERYGEILVTSLMSSEMELGPKKRLLSWEELESKCWICGAASTFALLPLYGIRRW